MRNNITSIDVTITDVIVQSEYWPVSIAIPQYRVIYELVELSALDQIAACWFRADTSQ